MGNYQPEPFIKPGPNLQAVMWLVLLALPAMVLFMIFSKTETSGESHGMPAPMMQPHR